MSNETVIEVHVDKADAYQAAINGQNLYYSALREAGIPFTTSGGIARGSIETVDDGRTVHYTWRDTEYRASK